jgi:ribonucleoside-diphosphate reductase alpha chain
MRTVMTAGVPLDRDNVAGYNCSYVAVDDYKVFDETMYILMCGTGLGFSVERQFINQLGVVGESTYSMDSFYKVDPSEISRIEENVIIVEDSKYGWASALRILVTNLFAGNFDVAWDLSKLRPAGAPLKTFGGRSSGPEPLNSLFHFFVEIFMNAEGRKLNSLECHDLMCKIADIVVVGGVRRSALLSLSNLTDERMRKAKSGEWYLDEPQRALANNSVCYTEKPDIGIFMKEWMSLYESKSGERGLFSREAANKMIPARREKRDDYGCNPCSEIILRSKQFCNLSEVIVRPDDNFGSLKEKVRIATIFGTLQSSLTDFKYLSESWKRNTEEEALLGVSLTGIMDHPVLGSLSHPKLRGWLESLKEYAIEVNKEWAEKLGVRASKAITCVKPSGTVSQLVDSASGIHPRYSEFYVRTVRADKKDPLAVWMREQGFPSEDCVMKGDTTEVFSFPMKSPEGSVMRNDRSAIEQLELWKIYATVWCEHKPSITVYVKEDEWFDVGAWVYRNFDIMSGVSFLPHSNHSYRQAPYQEIDERKYQELLSELPMVEFSDYREYEDNSAGNQTMACSAGVCEIVDL